MEMASRSYRPGQRQNLQLLKGLSLKEAVVASAALRLSSSWWLCSDASSCDRPERTTLRCEATD